ncbi:MAG TPA: TAXI family TRAP transporter solute-binding subunit [Alphaproteobacteria bacterium]
MTKPRPHHTALAILFCICAGLGWSLPAAAQGANTNFTSPPDWPHSLIVSTASPGGTYYVYGEALAKALSAELGLMVSSQPTQGADQNIILLEQGQAGIGFVTMGVALQAWTGNGAWTRGQKFRAMRAIFPMYDTPFHIVVLKGGPQSLDDMMGKRVGVGPRGGTGGTYLPDVFKALNVQVTIANGAYADQGTQLRERILDVLTGAAGAPFPMIAEIEKQAPIDFVNLTPAQIETLHKAMPELSASIVPARTYTSLKGDYHTVGLYNFAVVNKALPEDLVYAIVKATFTNHDRLVAAHPAAAETVPANVSRNSFLPFHRGAVRYYREIGVQIPDALTMTD